MTQFEVGKFYRITGKGNRNKPNEIWHRFKKDEIVKLVFLCEKDHCYKNAKGGIQYVQDDQVELTQLTNFPRSKS